MILPLDKVEINENARNGGWCKLPYPGHPAGCPNFPKCIDEREDFKDLPTLKWFAIVTEFNLKEHAQRMKEKHPQWTEKQCRNVLYWQGKVRASLKRMSKEFAGPDDIILDIPEACGVNVFLTMKNHGIELKPRPDLVRKIMMVGKRGRIEDFLLHVNKEKTGGGAP